jgi:surfeit locus 1 family protein
MRAAFFVILIGLVGTGILVGLGFWQVQRLAWKESVIAEIDSRIAAEPAPLPAAPDAPRDRYLPVRVEGQFLPGELHVLVSIKQVGPGYRIIAPFQTEGGKRILIDRGFVPTARKTVARAGGAQTVIGNLHWPQETDSYTPAPDLAGNTWFARDVPLMAAALDTDPVLLVARSRTDADINPLPVDSSGIPNDHLQYAITWFSLAAIWAAMTAAYYRRTRAPKTSG